MALDLVHVCIFIVVVANCVFSVNGWDSEELELFDLVEEVNENFYTVLGVDQDADARNIRKAFRNLSLILHPDKNDAPDADTKFRQLVAIHEILRDPAKRRRYNEVLENGLPDWRHAVYYYRRVRKMGMAEMLVILFIIVTIGQYIVGWAAYLEKKYIVEEYVTTQKKRLLKKQKKGKLDGDIPEMTIEIPKPSIFNTLPFQIPKFLWVSITSIPVSVKLFIQYCMERRKKKYENESSEEEEIEQETWVKGPRRRRNFTIPEIQEESKPNGGCVLESVESPDSESEEQRPVSGGLWTDDDLSDLIKLVNKYPVGTAKRWEKVASAMGRSVSEVVHMAKKVKEGMAVRSETSNEVVEEPIKKVKTRGGKHGALDEGAQENSWSQAQQTALENALMKYQKQTVDRWERIAEAVPGKTKEECIVRFKLLHSLVKKKKQSET